MTVDELLAEPDWNRCRALATDAQASGTLTTACLLSACDNADPARRRRALLLLAQTPAAAADVPLELLEDACWPVREAAVACLGPVDAVIRATIRDPSPHVRTAAAKAAGPAALPVIREAMIAHRWKVRRKAAAALTHLPAADAVPLLEALLADPHEHVRAAAAASLGRLGEAARPALEALRRRLGERSPRVAAAAREALAALGEEVGREGVEPSFSGL